MQSVYAFPVFLATGLWGCLPIQVKAQKSKPNILILTADDLGWNDVSSSITTEGRGSKNMQTPNIDRFISEGMAFTRAYTQQNSAPTRAALLTGEYANHTKVYNVGSLARFEGDGSQSLIIPPIQKDVIDPTTITFAEMLRNNGYRNYIFGKVHGWGGDLNKNHGFDDDFSCDKVIKTGKKKSSNYFASLNPDGKWMFDSPKYDLYAQPYTKEYIEKKLIPFANGNDPRVLEGTPKHLTDAIADCVIDQLKATDKKQPFCMWVCFHAIHSAVVSREDLYAKYRMRTEMDPRHSDFKYAALTEQLDQTVGRILAALDDPNGDGNKSDSMRGNTIVLFMSDNGGVGNKHSNAPLRGEKGMFYEGGVRIPFAVRYPGVIPAGSVSSEPIHVIDLYPTLAEMSGSKLPKPSEHLLDGESFAPILQGKAQALHRSELFWHFPGYLDTRLAPTSVVNKRIGNKRYKLHYFYEAKRFELYCLTNDEMEKVNLLESSPKPEDVKIAQDLRKDLCDWLTKTDPLKMLYRENKQEVGLPVEIR